MYSLGDNSGNNFEFRDAVTMETHLSKDYLYETDNLQFNGISGIHAKKKSVNHNSDFLERFQGR